MDFGMVKKLLTVCFLITINLVGSTQDNTSDILNDRFLNSEAIIIGKVVNSNSFWDKGQKNIYTRYTIKTIEIIKGNEISEFELFVKGGIVDNIWHRVTTSVELGVGDIGYFFLNIKQDDNGLSNNPDRKYFLNGGKEGFIKLNENSDLFRLKTQNSVIEQITTIEGVNFRNENLIRSEPIKTKSASSSHSITKLSPLVSTAGTGSLLNISGKGFGNSQGNGEIWFVNSDNVSTRYTDIGFEIKGWTDTLIQVIIPDQAATGKVWVRIGDSDAESPEILTIRYSHNNVRFKPTILVNTNQQGGYTWHIDLAITQNNNAHEIIKRSINKWVCATQIPWRIGDPKNVEPGWDGFSTISFGEVEYGLAEANYYYSAITSNGTLTGWAVDEMDIVFSDKEKWSYNRNQIAFDQFDFETVVLHELGHSHMMGHINNNDDLMFYAIGRQVIKNIGSTNIECGKYIINKSLQLSHPDFETIILPEILSVDKPGAISGEIVVCSGQNSVTYTVAPVLYAESYIWTLPFGAEGKSSTNSITVNYGPNSRSGEISVAGFNACGQGQASSLAIEVKQLPHPAGIITGENSICTGNDPVTYSIAPISNATSYQWTLPDGVSGTSVTERISVIFNQNAVSGKIIVKGINACGAGELSTLDIKVNNKPPAPVITFRNDTLFSNAGSGNQWYHQNQIIEGATGKEYKISRSGNYHAVVTINGCSSDISNIIPAVLSDADFQVNNNTFRVYPNPFSNTFIIEPIGSRIPYHYEIKTVTGETVFKGVSSDKTLIDAKNLSSGIYFVVLTQGNRIESLKILKN